MKVDASVGILIQSLRLNLLMMFLLEEALHDLFLTATRIGKDSKLAVHVLLLFEPIDALIAHALKHLIGEIDLPSAQLFHIEGILVAG